MTLRFHASLQFDTRQAKAELQAATQATNKIGEAFKKVSRATFDASGQLDRYETQARAATQATQQAARAARDYEAATDRVGKTSDLSAGQVGNLVAQFNDIGVMLAAGQNPLQLAIQQGTQITQVFGQMGAGQAVKALGAALRSMVSPINLITIGAIAAGAAFTQWLTRSTDDATALTDALEGARAKVAELRQDSEALRRGFGSVEEFALAEQIAAVQQDIARAEADAATASGRNANAAKLRADRLREVLAPLQQELADLQALEVRNEAVRAANAARFDEIANAYRENRAQLDDMLAGLQQENALLAIQAQYGEDSAEFQAAQADASRTALDAVLAAIPGHDAVKDAIRDAYDNQIDLNAAINAADLSGLSGQAALLAQHMGFAASEAERYNAALNIAAGLQDVTPSAPGGDGGLSLGLPGMDVPQGTGFANLGFGAATSPTAPPRRISANFSSPPARAARSRSGGAAREERDLVKELTEDLDRRLAILNETDPVQRELLRHARALADATEAQKQTVTDKIAELQREEALQGRITDLSTEAGNATISLLRGITEGGNAAQQALARIADRLVDIGLEALVLGSGPLGGLFGGGLFGGGGGGGGFFRQAASALLGRKDGGPIYGIGGPRDDAQLIRVSPGEHIMTARAAQQYRPILEAMNAGAPIPGFAAGGAVGGGAAPGSNVLFAPVFIDRTSGGVQMRQVEDQTGPGGARQPAFEFSDVVANAMNKRGGAAQQQLQAGGLRRPRADR